MSTRATIVTSASWTELGSGPLLAETGSGSNAYVHFSNSVPDISEQAFHELSGPSYISYEGNQKCYARASNDTAVVIVTEWS